MTPEPNLRLISRKTRHAESARSLALFAQVELSRILSRTASLESLLLAGR